MGLLSAAPGATAPHAPRALLAWLSGRGRRPGSLSRPILKHSGLHLGLIATWKGFGPKCRCKRQRLGESALGWEAMWHRGPHVAHRGTGCVLGVDFLTSLVLSFLTCKVKLITVGFTL